MASTITCPNCGAENGPEDIVHSGASFEVNETYHCGNCEEILDKDRASVIYE
ncbi:MAG: hypothetical protein ABEJ35_07595 [Halobacteriaceae archaeon]